VRRWWELRDVCAGDVGGCGTAPPQAPFEKANTSVFTRTSHNFSKCFDPLDRRPPSVPELCGGQVQDGKQTGEWVSWLVRG
jgi:hypothetical protein